MAGAQVFLTPAITRLVSHSVAAELQQVIVAFATILVFGVMGVCGAIVGNQDDVVPLVVLELIGFGILFVAVLMAAVETGRVDVLRNLIVGTLGLIALATTYLVVLRLRR